MKPYQTVIDIIRDLARDAPDRTPEDAYFDYDGKIPECIFGHALAILGAVPVRLEHGFVVRSPEGLDLVKGYQSASLIEWENIGIESPNDAEARWSDRVQERQDSGDTWGEAVRYADGSGIL